MKKKGKVETVLAGGGGGGAAVGGVAGDAGRDAGGADDGRAVAGARGHDEVGLVLDEIVAPVPGPDVGVPVLPRLRQRVQFEAARHPRLVAAGPIARRRPLRLLQHRLLRRGQFLSFHNRLHVNSTTWLGSA